MPALIFLYTFKHILTIRGLTKCNHKVLQRHDRFIKIERMKKRVWIIENAGMKIYVGNLNQAHFGP